MNGVYVGNNPNDLTQYEGFIGGEGPELLSLHTGHEHWGDFIGSIRYAIETWASTEVKPHWSIPLTVKVDENPAWTGTGPTGWAPLADPGNKATLAEAAAGNFNAYYKNAAKMLLQAEAGEKEIYVRTGWELNGGFPWSLKSEADVPLFREAFRQFVDSFREAAREMGQDPTKFKFEWNVQQEYEGASGFNIEGTYPGPEYVDFIGMDFYWKSWPDSPALDSEAAWGNLTRIEKSDEGKWLNYNLSWLADFAGRMGKPIAISEWGVPQNKPHPTGNPDEYAGHVQVRDASAYIQNVHQWFADHNVAYQMYWNSDADYIGKLDMTPGSTDLTANAYRDAFDGIEGNGVAGVPPESGAVTNWVLSPGLDIPNETLIGTSQNDMLNGRGGGDTLDGGAGDDTYELNHVNDVVVESADGGIDTVRAWMSRTLEANVENLVLTGNGWADGTGNALNNRLTGNESVNTLDGRGGDDWLTGGAGADTFVIRKGEGNDTITDFEAGAGSDERIRLDGFAFADGAAVIAAAQEFGGDVRINLGGGQTLTLKGVAAASLVPEDFELVNSTVEPPAPPVVEGPPVSGAVTNWVLSPGTDIPNETLVGTAQNDMLNGRGGGDTLRGGAGDDTYVLNHANDVVDEDANGGIDTVEAWMGRTLEANVENLVLTGNGWANGTGNALNNRITGNSSVNTLDGRGGDDWLTGGEGNDTFVFRKGEGNDTITDFVAGAASSELIRLDGFDFANTDAVLAASTQVGSDVRVNLGDGQFLTLKNMALANLVASDFELVNSTAAPPTPVEGPPVSGAVTNWVLSPGTDIPNENLVGTAQNDMLNGRGGGDTLRGGAGDDTYVLNHASDVVVEAAGGGIDTVEAWMSRTLEDNVENLVLTSDGWISGTGNELNNRITGNAGSNTINGKGGNDWLTGGGGSDTFVIGRAEGNDTITDFAAGAGGDVIRLEGLPFTSFNAVMSRAAQVGTDVVINLGGGQNLTLLNQTVGALTASNFSLQYAAAPIIYTPPTSAATTPDATSTVTGTTAAGQVLVGTNANDSLNGGGGGDTLRGGSGHDTYTLVHQGDRVVEKAFEGIYGTPGVDKVVTTLSSHVLADNVENLTFTGAAAHTGTGNRFDNNMVGGSGADTLNGKRGFDFLTGGAGADTFVLERGMGHDTVMDFSSGQGDKVRLENFGLTDFAGAMSKAYQFGADVIFNLGNGDGLTLKNTALASIKATDLSIVEGTATLSAAVIKANSGLSSFGTLPTNTINYGTTTKETRTGTNGNDIFYNAGGDTVHGGSGDDWYYIDSLGGLLVEYVGAGNDTVLLESAGTYYLHPNVESLIMTGNQVMNVEAVTGNLAQRLIGNDQANAMNGKGGNDILTGGGGSDTFVIEKGLGHDFITDFEGAGVAGGDVIQFKGFGAGATLGHSGDVWFVKAADQSLTYLTVENVTNLVQGDYVFV